MLSIQCDQMLKLKVAKVFQNLPKKTHSNFNLRSDLFQIGPKSHEIFGQLLKELCEFFVKNDSSNERNFVISNRQGSGRRRLSSFQTSDLTRALFIVYATK